MCGLSLQMAVCVALLRLVWRKAVTHCFARPIPPLTRCAASRVQNKEPLKHPKWNDESEDEVEAEEGASDGGAGAFRRSGRLAARTTTGSTTRRSAAAPTGTRDIGNSSSDNEVEQPTPSSGRSVGALLHPDDGKDRSLGLLCERCAACFCCTFYAIFSKFRLPAGFWRSTVVARTAWSCRWMMRQRACAWSVAASMTSSIFLRAWIS